VTNRFGTVRVDLGEVTLYELPPFTVDFGYLPRPQVPSLPPFSMEQLRPVLEGIGTVRLPELPPLPALRTFDLVETLMAGMTMTVPLPSLDEAVTVVTGELMIMLRAEAAEVAAGVRDKYLASQGK
jgi:hypothetical protein